MILVVGHQEDPHIKAVVDWLQRLDSSFTLWDVYSSNSDGILHGISDDVLLSIGDKKIDISEITSVWWRQKPKFLVPSDSAIRLYDYYFVQREWNTLFDYVANKTKTCFSINNRANSKRAENKALQLEMAKEFNFIIPKTIISNCVKDVANYFETNGVNRCIYKSFSPYMPPSAKFAYTTEIDLNNLSESDHQETIDVTPGIFQELIETSYELRVTVVGTEVFAVRIDTPANNKNNTDWRISIFKNKYTKTSLDEMLESTLLEYHKKLGLFFAAYDFIVDTNDNVFFLEVNPSGQWMWLEQELDLPISKSIAQGLINH